MTCLAKHIYIYANTLGYSLYFALCALLRALSFSTGNTQQNIYMLYSFLKYMCVFVVCVVLVINRSTTKHIKVRHSMLIKLI